MIRLISILALAMVSLSLPAQDEARVLSAFKKAFAAPKGKKPGRPLPEKQAALAATAGLDSGKTAAALVTGWQGLATELGALDVQRADYRDEMAGLIKGQEASERRTLPQAKFQRLNQLKPLMAKLREQCDGLRELHLKLSDRIAELRRKDSVLYLLKKVTGSKKADLPLRLAAGRAIGGASSEVIEELATAVSRAKKPPEQIVLLDAMALAGEAAQVHATPVIKLLSSKEDAVAERAALALAKIAVPEAVAPMITLLSRSTGQMKLRVAAALEVLTGEQHGDNIGAWNAWWKIEGPSFRSSGRALGAGTPSHRKKTNDNYYFGIPQADSKSILYVIDCSGSMRAPVKMKGGTGDTTRMEACKTELIRGLGKLQPTQSFAIIWYNDLPHFWEDKMLPASKANIARAQDFVRGLSHASSTNIHDSLELGFGLAGRGSYDKYYGTELDTVFLLTDGSPTKP
ncbi:MAG: hypothetical protein VYA51_02175, partial [Planctomycetota bacterium]|nr:hypothetical protein [Planctomycetota bacterium]